MNETLNGVLGGTDVYGTNYNISWDLTSLLTHDQKEELMTRLLENEDEFMPILKKYLVGYLDKILDNPEQIIKEVVMEKDEKIKNLENKVRDLESEIEKLKALSPVKLNPIIDTGDYWRSMPEITWDLDNLSNSGSSIFSTSSSTV